MARRKRSEAAGAVRISAEELITVPVAELVPYEHNARTHSDEQVERLRRSLREFGFVAPILIDEERRVIAGHGRLLAAQAEGMESVPCVRVGSLTEAQRRAYILADNRLAEDAGWDEEALRFELDEIAALDFDVSLTGFDVEPGKPIHVREHDRAAAGEGEEPPEAEDDDYDGQVPETCPYHPGDVFKLGRHLLVCGDCTDEEATSNFQSGGVDLLLTDPPYNVALGNNESVDTARARHRRTDGVTISNDDMPEDAFEKFLARAFGTSKKLMRPGAGFYIWHASSTAQSFLSAVSAVGWSCRETLIWNKNHFTLSRQDYHWKHEPCLYGWNEGAPHYWAGGRAQSTVLDFDRPTRSEDHPTMKPIPLFDRLIRNSCPMGGVVYDPFGGSGTTLLACEQNGRTCWMVELDPRFVAVIIRRWEALTGQKAVLLDR